MKPGELEALLAAAAARGVEVTEVDLDTGEQRPFVDSRPLWQRALERRYRERHERVRPRPVVHDAQGKVLRSKKDRETMRINLFDAIRCPKCGLQCSVLATGDGRIVCDSCGHGDSARIVAISEVGDSTR